MRKSVHHLAAVIGAALAPLATVALANPAVSSAQPKRLVGSGRECVPATGGTATTDV
jgi:hypothetical protein